MPSSATAFSSAESAAEGTRSSPAGPTCSSSLRRPVTRSRREHRDGARVRNRGRDRAEADPLGHAEAPGDREHVATQLLPAEVGLRTRQHEHVPFADPSTAHRELGPRELAEPAVDDVEHRPARAEVEQQVGVERRDRQCVIRHAFGRRRRGTRRVDPAVQGGDDRRCDERLAGLAQQVEGHDPRIAPATVGASGPARPAPLSRRPASAERRPRWSGARAGSTPWTSQDPSP